MKTSRWWPIAEAAIVAALAVSWSLGYLVAEDDINKLNLTQRAARFAIYETDNRLTLGYVFGLAALALLAVRRFAPLPTFIGAAALSAAVGWWYTLIASESFAMEAVVVVGAFAAVWGTGRWLVVSAIAVASLVIGNYPWFEINRQLSYFGADTSGNIGPANRILALLVLASLSIGAGLLVRRLGQQAEQLAAQNQELSQTRAAGERAAILSERVRIARELHDVVAHHVTAMTVHAGAARQVSQQDPPVVEALALIESSGRAAIEELHRMLGFLRSSESDEMMPAPTLGDLENLVRSLDEKLDVDLQIMGETSVVPAGVQVSGYRIVQEALTNVLKHSKTTSATVAIQISQDQTRVQVQDPGPSRDNPGSGHGLVGINERVTQHGGSSIAGPLPTGGWHVAATLQHAPPIETATAEPGSAENSGDAIA